MPGSSLNREGDVISLKKFARVISITLFLKFRGGSPLFLEQTGDRVGGFLQISKVLYILEFTLNFFASYRCICAYVYRQQSS